MVFMGLFLFQVAKRMFSKASYLRLDYPIAKYDFENECPFTFEMNSEAVIKGEKIVGLRLRIQNESDYLFDLQTCK
jgi:hypothetical protein